MAKAKANGPRRKRANTGADGVPGFDRLNRLNAAITGHRHARGGAAAFHSAKMRRRTVARAISAFALLMIFGTTALLASSGYARSLHTFRVDLDDVTSSRGNLNWAMGPSRELIQRHLCQSLQRTIRERIDPEAVATGDSVDVRVSLLDEGLVNLLREAFVASPWIEEVHAVRIAYPRTIKVSFTLRKPHVAALCDAGFLLLDHNQVLLPLAFSNGMSFREFNEHLRPKLSVLVGCPSPPTVAGGVWEDRRIRAGVEVNACIQPITKLVPVDSIDVSNVGGILMPDGESEVTLTVRAPSGQPVTLEWGRAPSDAQVGENTIDQKLANLRTVAEAFPTLEGISSIDLRFPEPDLRRLID